MSETRIKKTQEAKNTEPNLEVIKAARLLQEIVVAGGYERSHEITELLFNDETLNPKEKLDVATTVIAATASLEQGDNYARGVLLRSGRVVANKLLVGTRYPYDMEQILGLYPAELRTEISKRNKITAAEHPDLHAENIKAANGLVESLDNRERLDESRNRIYGALGVSGANPEGNLMEGIRGRKMQDHADLIARMKSGDSDVRADIAKALGLSS